MPDGRVIDWDSGSGTWSLFSYDPLSKTNVLPGPPIRSGTWASIKDRHILVRMHDGRLLDWDSTGGGWILWNYDASNKSDILVSIQASGVWPDIKTGWDIGFPPTRRLIRMPDGNVLDWGPMEKGVWQLRNYAPGFSPNVLPSIINSGQWKSILAGRIMTPPHWLIPMCDGRVLDWVREDGSFRLWSYEPSNPGEIFPGEPVAEGQWKLDKWGWKTGPDDLAVMPDGRVLAWVPSTGQWSLWECDLPERMRPAGPGFKIERWFAEADPLSKVISMSLYATLTKPRPPVSRVVAGIAALLRELGAADRRSLAQHLKALKGYIEGIEDELGHR